MTEQVNDKNKVGESTPAQIPACSTGMEMSGFQNLPLLPIITALGQRPPPLNTGCPSLPAPPRKQADLADQARRLSPQRRACWPRMVKGTGQRPPKITL